MKKRTLLLMAAIMAFSLNAYAVDIDVKAGIATPKKADTVSFDASVNLNIPLVPMSNDGGVGVYLGINPAINWVKWEDTIGSSNIGGGLTVTQKDTMNMLTIPMIANLELRFPVFLSERASAFYIGAGAGYAMGMYDYKSYDGKSTGDGSFGGLAAQGYLGLGFNLNNNVYLLAEVGYRYADLKGDIEIKNETITTKYVDQSLDMSGFVAHLGVRFAFGGGDF